MSLFQPTPPSITQLCGQWQTPPLNWLDYFVKPKMLRELLADANNNKDKIRELTLQYLEQSMVCEKDAAVLMNRQLPTDDILFSQRKVVCHWMCTLACFAALEWDFESLVDEKKHNIHLIRILIDKVYTVLHDKEFCSIDWPIIFSEFLVARWILYVNRKLRTPPPAGKPTTNNPKRYNDYSLEDKRSGKRMAQEDQGVLKANFSRRAAVEVKNRAGESAAEMERTLLECGRLEAPSFECFLQPFIQNVDAFLSVGVLGLNVLCEGLPHPDFEIGRLELAQIDLQNMCRFELAAFNFGKMQFTLAKKYIQELVAALPPKSDNFALIHVKLGELNGYCTAFKLPPISTSPTVKRRSPIDDQYLRDDGSLERRLAVRRMRSEKDTRGAMVVITKAENLARECVDGLPICVSARFKDPIHQGMERFAVALSRLLLSVRDRRRQNSIRALIRYISATVPGMFEALKQVKDPTFTRPFIMQLEKPFVPMANQHAISSLCEPESSSQFWQILTLFDPHKLRISLSLVEDFVVPVAFKYPDLLADVVLPSRQFNAFYAVLLGKMEQLCVMKKQKQWEEFVSTCSSVCDPMNRNQDRAIIEAIRVQSNITNQLLHSAHEPVNAADIANLSAAVKKILTEPSLKDTLNIPQSTEFHTESLAYLLNVGELPFILSLPQKPSPMTTISMLLAAFVGVENSEQQRTFAKGCSDLIEETGLFETPKRGSAIPSDSVVAKERIELLRFIKLLTDQNHLSFLISYICHLYNRCIASDKEAVAMFGFGIDYQYSELWKNNDEIPSPHIDFIEEALVTALRSGLEINPTNAFWLRTYADYNYTKCDTDECLTLYMEALCSCTDNLHPPFPENVLNDRMWSRMRVCFTRNGAHTLAGLVTQLMTLNQGKDLQYQKVSECLRSQYISDAGECFSPLIFDHSFAEMLTDVYDATGQNQKIPIITSSTGKPAMNMSNPSDIFPREQAKRTHRLLRTMAALIFRVHC